MKRILINGFGRIGRCVFRNLWERGNNSQCVAVNDPAMSIDNMVLLMAMYIRRMMILSVYLMTKKNGALKCMVKETFLRMEISLTSML